MSTKTSMCRHTHSWNDANEFTNYINVSKGEEKKIFDWFRIDFPNKQVNKEKASTSERSAGNTTYAYNHFVISLLAVYLNKLKTL